MAPSLSPAPSDGASTIQPARTAAILAGGVTASVLFCACIVLVRYLTRRRREARAKRTINVGVSVDVFTVQSNTPVDDFASTPSIEQKLQAILSQPRMAQRSDSDMSLSSTVTSPCDIREIQHPMKRPATPSHFHDVQDISASSLHLDSSVSLGEVFSTMDVDSLTRSTVRFPRMPGSQDVLDEYPTISSLHSTFLRDIRSCDDHLEDGSDISAISGDSHGMTLRLDVISPCPEDDSYDFQASTLTFPTIPSLRTDSPGSTRAFSQTIGAQSQAFRNSNPGALEDSSMDLSLEQDTSADDSSSDTLTESVDISDLVDPLENTLVQDRHAGYDSSFNEESFPVLESPAFSQRSAKQDYDLDCLDVSPQLAGNGLLAPAFSPIVSTSLSPLKLELSPSSRIENASMCFSPASSEGNTDSFDADCPASLRLADPAKLPGKDFNASAPVTHDRSSIGEMRLSMACPTPHILDLTLPSTPLMDEILPTIERGEVSACLSVVTMDPFAYERSQGRVGRVLQPLFESFVGYGTSSAAAANVRDNYQMHSEVRHSVSSLKSAFTFSEPFSVATPPLLPFISLISNPSTPTSGAATTHPDRHPEPWEVSQSAISDVLSSPPPSRPLAPTPGSFLSQLSPATSPARSDCGSHLRVPSPYSPGSSNSPFERPQAPTPGSVM